MSAEHLGGVFLRPPQTTAQPGLTRSEPAVSARYIGNAKPQEQRLRSTFLTFARAHDLSPKLLVFGYQARSVWTDDGARAAERFASLIFVATFDEPRVVNWPDSEYGTRAQPDGARRLFPLGIYFAIHLAGILYSTDTEPHKIAYQPQKGN
jgi:hypothetical protein